MLGSYMFVERFMAWSVVSGADQRANAISRLAVKFFNGRVAEEDRLDVEKTLTLYLNDSSAKVRTALAKVVARHENAPRHLVWALARDIKVLLLDEPYEGLAPVIVQEIAKTLDIIRDQGITTIIVEQNAVAALKLADRAVILDTGRVVYDDSAQKVLEDEQLRAQYLAI